jgi:hypothetical protein
MRRTSIFWLALFALFISTTAWAAVPQALHYSGKLDTAGGVFTGTIEVAFALYAEETGGGSFWSEKLAVSVVKGRFDVQLGKKTAIKPTDLDVEALYVGVAVGEDDEMERMLISSVPYALNAIEAVNAVLLGGLPASEFATLAYLEAYTLAGLQNCQGGAVPTWDKTKEAWICGEGGGSGTTYSAGAGLALKTGVFSLDTSGCAANEVLKRTSQNDGWECVADATSGTTYSAGTGLSLSGTTFGLKNPTSSVIGGLKAKTCSSGQFVSALGSNGSAICGTPSGGSGGSYSAGTGLSLSGTTFNLNTPTSSAIGGIKAKTCSSGQFLSALGTNGSATCGTPSGGSGGSYSAGTGLSLSGATFSLRAPSTNTIGGIMAKNCSSGQFVSVIGTNGSVSCGTPSGGGGGGSYTAGDGLNLSGTKFSLSNPTSTVIGGVKSKTCTNSQFLRKLDANGALTCATDANTTYSAGNGINLTSTTLSANTEVVQARVSGTCGAGKSIRVIKADGTVTCETDTDTTRSDGDIEAVVAAAGYVPGPHVVSSAANVATVSASSGDYTTLAWAMFYASTWCTGATATNRCVIRLGAGTHTVDAEVTIPSNMDIVGEGATNTVITRAGGSDNIYSAGVLQMSDNTSLRDVTIQNTGSTSHKFSAGVYVTNSSNVTLDRINVDVSGAKEGVGGMNIGVRVDSSTVIMNDSTIKVHTAGLGTPSAVGLHNYDLTGHCGADCRLVVNRTTIDVAGGDDLTKGLWSTRELALTDVIVAATGTTPKTSDIVALSLIANGDSPGNNEQMTIDHCRIASAGIGVYRSGGMVRILYSTVSSVWVTSTQTSWLLCYNSYNESYESLSLEGCSD